MHIRNTQFSIEAAAHYRSLGDRGKMRFWALEWRRTPQARRRLGRGCLEVCSFDNVSGQAIPEAAR